MNRRSSSLPGPVQRFVAVLLALVVGAAAASPGALTPPIRGGGAVPACHCCRANTDTCATPSCCAVSGGRHAPAAPASQCRSGMLDWQALSVATPVLAALHNLLLAGVSPAVTSLLPVRAVPIFQRDCSYLI